ncbi:hypothetical protein [Janthinobacterium sp. CG_23.4]|nr:hypothetical protein [Janthinobacterium sp. CG_23.4]
MSARLGVLASPRPVFLAGSIDAGAVTKALRNVDAALYAQA